MSLLFISISQYSSDLYEIARGLLRSRNRQAERADSQIEIVRELRLVNEALLKRLQTAEEKFDQSQQLLQQEQRENQLLRQQPFTLLNDLPLPNKYRGTNKYRGQASQDEDREDEDRGAKTGDRQTFAEHNTIRSTGRLGGQISVDSIACPRRSGPRRSGRFACLAPTFPEVSLACPRRFHPTFSGGLGGQISVDSIACPRRSPVPDVPVDSLACPRRFRPTFPSDVFQCGWVINLAS